MDALLDEYVGALSAIAIEGAKAVGKTATAQQRATTVFKLDEPEGLALVQADTARVLRAEPPVLIDEWQRHPPIWDAVRRADDAGAEPGSFLLTGSADPRDVPAHTGAGRIITVRMRPMSFAERLPGQQSVSLTELLEGGQPSVEGEALLDLEGYVAEILQSGFPGLRRLTGVAHRAQLTSYLNLIVEKDFKVLGQVLRNPEALRRWMAAYAAAVSTTASFETIRRAATSNEEQKPAKTTVGPYRDALQRLFVLDPSKAWRPANNAIAELGDAEKHDLVDPALAARLVRATEGTLLDGKASGPAVARNGTQLGALFESLVAQSIRTYASVIPIAEDDVRHLRVHRGDHEIDVIVERDDGHVVAIEVKLTATPSDADGRHLNWLQEQVGDQLIDRMIITTGKHAYRRDDGIAVVPAVLLGP